MSENRKNDAVWFVAGVGLGALAGILLAPKSGRETREAIATEVENGREYLTSLGRDAREHVEDIVESGKKMLARKKEQVGAAIETGRQALHDAGAHL
jgi:gas vesicle protein